LTSSTPFPEVNGTSFDNYRGNNGRGYEHGRNQGGRTQNIPRKNTTPYHRKWNYNETNNMEMEKVSRINPQKTHEEKCHRCGMKGNWLRTCRTAKHIVDLYQAPIKGNQNSFY
jgi:hypothetical protein